MPILELMATIVLFYPTLALIIVSSILQVMIKILWHYDKMSFIGFINNSGKNLNKPYNLDDKRDIYNWANEIVSTNMSCSTNSHTLF